jgi:autotransporter translocation and assembly factor TamB
MRRSSALSTAAKAAGLGLVFTLAAAGGVILHVGLPAPRRFVTARVNAVLAASFRGTITLQRVGALSLTRASGLDAEVIDPGGRRVLVIRGVRARFATWTLVRSILGGGRVEARVPEIGVDEVEAVVEEDASGELGLVRAFDPRRPSTPSTGERGMALSVPAIRLRHAWVHGHLATIPVIDADLEDLRAALASTPEMTTIDVGHLFVRGRGLGGMSPEGIVEARAALPADPAGEKQVSARYEGRAGEIPLRAGASLAGKEVAVVADVPETAPAAFDAIAPGRIHLGAPVSVHAEVHGELPVLRPEIRARIGGSEIVAAGTVTLPVGARTDLAGSAHLRVKNLDASLLQEGAPASRLTAALDAEGVSRPGGEIAGTFHLENEVGEVSGHVVPAASVVGAFTRSSVRGSARIAERGAPTTVRFSLEPPPGGASPVELALAVDTTVPDLGAIPRAGRLGRGRAHLVAEGRVDLHARSFSADASVEIADLDVKGVELARGVVTASAQGTLASPRFAGRMVGVGMRAGGVTFTRVSATARGTPRALDVTADMIGDDHAPTVHVSTSLDGRRLRGEVVASLGEAGNIDLSAADVTLGGAATDPRAWETATGRITLDGAVDLGELLAVLPPGARPIEGASGRVTVRGEAVRPSRSASPLVTLDASTKGLTVKGPARFRTVGVDGALALRLSPSTGRVQVSAKLHDREGPLASVDASTTLPMADLAAGPRRLLALLGDTPIEARIEVPRRSLDALPPALGEPPARGEVELTAVLAGTPRAPKLDLTAKGTNLIARGASTCVRPVDLDARVAYDGEEAAVRLAATRDGREIAGAGGTVKVSAARALAGGALAWEASADVALTRFPLDTIAPLLERTLAGEVSGAITARDLHRAAAVDANLDLHGVTLDRATFPSGKVRLTVDHEALSASARLDQADGYAEAKATGAVTWGAALAPRLDLTRPVDVSVHSKNFRAAAAMPFVRGVFSELDGRIDTDAQIHMDPGGKEGHVDGALVVRDGSFQVPQVGERFHGIEGRVIMRPWGTVRFERFAADARTGHLTASGQAVLQGLALRSARAEVHVEKGQSIPIALEGVSMGQAYGDVKATAQASPDGQRLDVDVDVPVLGVDLPHSIGRSVQPLEPDPTVRVGVQVDGAFVSIPLAPHQEPRPPSDLVVHAVVKLGKDVEVKRDATLDLTAHGQLDVLVSDQAHLSGQIDLDRGSLELQGKQFVLDHGSVSFVGSAPEDPMIVATAYWDAPDGTRVFADFSGFVTTGKLILRSDPPLSQDEILSLVLFGSPDGSFGAQPPSGAKVAGMAGGLLTGALNKAISGITSADITTRVDTSAANNPRPELAIQISRSVSARLGYKLGVPAPGENPDRTELTLDFRFIRRWSLVAVVGDQGSTALDVMWRKRY